MFVSGLENEDYASPQVFTIISDRLSKASLDECSNYFFSISLRENMISFFAHRRLCDYQFELSPAF